MLAGANTSTPEGVRFSESHVAAYLERPTVLIDITDGAAGAAEGVSAAAGLLGCDLVVYTDVGGDALAVGDEPGLGSPLCDAVMLAAGIRLGPAARRCDRRPRRRLRRRADARRGARQGRGAGGGRSLDRQLERHLGDRRRRRASRGRRRRRRRACRWSAARAARLGEAEIRGGRRRVPLGPVGALTFCFDLEAAAPELPLARP